jgi:serine/threonine protein phosphatase 1
MRIFVLTDIHGKNELFRKALKEIALKKTDKLILLGDLIDRGEDSKGILDTIFLLLEHGFNITCLMGNHEQLFLDAFLNVNNFNLWVLNGGDKTLSSFLTSSIEKIPTKYIELIKSFKYYYEFEQYILVHAALNMKIDNPFSDIKTLVWEREPLKFLDSEWLNDRKLVHGHNPMSQDEILFSLNNNESIISIDNGVYMKKKGFGTMCVLELKSFKIKFIV